MPAQQSNDIIVKPLPSEVEPIEWVASEFESEFETRTGESFDAVSPPQPQIPTGPSIAEMLLRAPPPDDPVDDDQFDWLSQVSVGYDDGFIISSNGSIGLGADDQPFQLQFNGWGQLRHTYFSADNAVRPDRNQFQSWHLLL